MVRLNVELEDGMMEALKALALQNDRSLTAEVRKALSAHLGKDSVGQALGITDKPLNPNREW